MKKLICTLLALSLVLAMTACGKQATETTTPETTAPEGALVGSMEELLECVNENVLELSRAFSEAVQEEKGRAA